MKKAVKKEKGQSQAGSASANQVTGCCAHVATVIWYMSYALSKNLDSFWKTVMDSKGFQYQEEERNNQTDKEGKGKSLFLLASFLILHGFLKEKHTRPFFLSFKISIYI